MWRRVGNVPKGENEFVSVVFMDTENGADMPIAGPTAWCQ